MSGKQAALNVIQGVPDDATLEEIMYELYFRQRIDRGLEQLHEGRTVTHEEVKRSLGKYADVDISDVRLREIGPC